MYRVLLLIPCALLFLGAEPAPIPKPSLNTEALDKLGWRLGCQAYTFRKLTLFETLDVLSAMGIRYVELYPGQRLSPQHGDTKCNHDMPQELIDELLAKCKAVNVTPVNYGVVMLPNDEAKSRKVFEFAKKMGMETIVSEPPADALPLIDKLAGEYNIKMAIHNHPKPSKYFEPESVLKVIDGCSDRVGACADVGHWTRSDLSAVECLRKLEGKIISLHFKDVAPETPNKDDVVWGTGKTDIAGVMKELARQKVPGKPLFAIEYETGEGAELIANVSKSVEYFSQVATELTK